MEANLFSILAVGTPVLAAPVALMIGLRKTLMAVCLVGIVILLGPYVYFGVWALIEGVSLWATLKAVAVSLAPASIIVGWMLAWSAAYGAIAALLRLCWLYWRVES
ncbi:MAG: hypothetical protein ABJP79_00875 [Tateyamaria sp.]|uniref:hypothetical protein n=1 Tax=Tateyamaria sp. TaxID=1929288 RepID=UPI00329E6391